MDFPSGGHHQPSSAPSQKHASSSSSSSCTHGGCVRDYELFECIGRGSYAECFRARCMHCSAALCIKRLDKSDIIRRKHIMFACTLRSLPPTARQPVAQVRAQGNRNARQAAAPVRGADDALLRGR
jgi:hypothetical protein